MNYAIDLIRLMHAFEASKKNVKLVRAIKSILLYQSCGADLEMASQSLTQLARIQAVAGSRQAQVLQQSLLMSCVIFYWRATTDPAPKYGGRGAAKIEHALPTELRSDHHDIDLIRKRAMAHVHIGKNDDDWHQQFLTLMPNEQGGYTLTGTHRANTTNTKTQEKLGRLVPRAQQIMAERLAEAEAVYKREFLAELPAMDVTQFYVDPREIYGETGIPVPVGSGRRGYAQAIFYDRSKTEDG